jgi:YHS domain-containing protein
MKIFTPEIKTVADPVCGMQIDPCKTDLATDYQERKFYFCAEGCRKAFEENPEKYTGVHSRKGWWGRYLAKLNKTTGGKPMNCH